MMTGTSFTAVWTLQLTGDNNPDTISVTVTATPGALRAYKYTGTGLPATGESADALRVFGYGGNDDITITSAVGPYGKTNVSGNTGDDKITLVNCTNVSITPLSLSDIDPGPAPADGADTIDLQSSPGTNAQGGVGDDKFTASGNNTGSTLDGGAGVDDFAVGGTFINSIIYGGSDNDIVTGSGNWQDSIVHGDWGNDRIDLRACTGNITLYGDDGDDIMFGGSSGNSFWGGNGMDRMYGGVGDDSFHAVDGQWDQISGGAHNVGDNADIDFPNPDGSDLDWLSGIEFVTYH
jgi:Ca2+-binding RTX toxin-like protein